MFENGKALVLAALLIPGAAFADINVGETLGASETAIRSALEAKGYEISEVEIESDEIEIEATLAGQEFEIEVDPGTGAILAVYAEDDDDDEDDDDNDG